MQDASKTLSFRETAQAVMSSLWMTVRSSPAFLAVIGTEELLGRILPFASAWVLAQLVSTLPNTIHHVLARTTAVEYIAALLVLAAVSPALNSLVEPYSARQKVELDLKIQRRLQEAFASLPFALYENKQTMDSYERANRFAGGLSNFVLYRLRNIFGNCVTLVVAAAAFWHFSPWLTLAIIVLSVPTFWVEIRLQGIRQKSWNDNARSFSRTYSYTDLLQPRMIQESRLLALTSYAIDKAQYYKRAGELAELQAQQTTQRYRLGSTLLGSAIEALVLLRALQQIVLGRLPVGQFLFVQQIAGQYLSAISMLTGQVQSFDDVLFGIADFAAITSFIVEEPEADVAQPKGDIVFEDVHFTYPGATKAAIRGISLTIPYGHTVAIVGENGAGKTTLVKLLMKVYDPAAGAVKVGSQSIQDINTKSWHRHIGVLFQDFITFHNFTLRENVWFGDITRERTDKAIDRAIHAADAEDFIDELPNGLDTYLGKFIDETNGTDISGGQAQRLAIARALYRHPELLILDEPTSAIDAKAEFKIFRAIEAVRKGKTTILISHRFSTVRRADYIYVLAAGRLKEQGTHDELIVHQGLYYEMFSKQAEGYR